MGGMSLSRPASPSGVHVFKAQPQWDVVWRWGLWEVIWVRLGLEGGALMLGLVP